MTIWEAAATVLAAALGGGGIVTIYIKHRLDKAEKEAERMRERRIAIKKAERKMWSATGRSLFWLRRSAEKGEKLNGEFAKAVEEFEDAESQYKEIEREVAAEEMK